MIRVGLLAAVLLALPAASQEAPAGLKALDRFNAAGLSRQWLIDAGARATLAEVVPAADPNAAMAVIDFDGSIYWNKAKVGIADLKEAVAEHTRDNPAKPVWVEWNMRASRDAAFNVVAAINEAGVAPVILPVKEVTIVRPPPRPGVAVVRPKADGASLAQRMAENYPRAAVRDRRQGDVTVSICVRADGRVQDVRVTESSGHADLDEATVKVIAAVKFSPARDATGKAVDWCEPPYALSVGWRIP